MGVQYVRAGEWMQKARRKRQGNVQLAKSQEVAAVTASKRIDKTKVISQRITITNRHLHVQVQCDIY